MAQQQMRARQRFVTENDRRHSDPDFFLYESVQKALSEYNRDVGDEVRCALYDDVQSTQRYIDVPLMSLSSIKSVRALVKIISTEIGTAVDVSFIRHGVELKATLRVPRPPPPQAQRRASFPLWRVAAVLLLALLFAVFRGGLPAMPSQLLLWRARDGSGAAATAAAAAVNIGADATSRTGPSATKEPAEPWSGAASAAPPAPSAAKPNPRMVLSQQ